VLIGNVSKAKIGRVTLREGVLVAKRYSPEDVLSSGIIDEVEGLSENIHMGLDSFDARSLSEVKMEFCIRMPIGL
jgi:hypothetical protein